MCKRLAGKQGSWCKDLDNGAEQGEGDQEKDKERLKEILQESERTEEGQTGNQMEWDQTGCCRRTAWQTRGGFHLLRLYVKESVCLCLCFCLCVCVCIDALYLVWMRPQLCLCSDVYYLCLWVSDSVFE